MSWEPKMGQEVLLYWPNVVGYIRIALVLCAWIALDCPAVFVPLYSASVVLDGLDGWLARRLGQSSRFGAWLDVVVDNLGRGMLWSRLVPWGWLVSALEWCVFVCNHGNRGDHWKSSFTRSPRLIRNIMANGFRTPLGVWVVAGLHLLPLWLYLQQHHLLLLLPPGVRAAATALLAVGRLLAMTAEMWCLWTHVDYLIRDEPDDRKKN